MLFRSYYLYRLTHIGTSAIFGPANNARSLILIRKGIKLHYARFTDTNAKKSLLLRSRRGADCIVMSMSVCLSESISQKPHVQTSLNFCAQRCLCPGFNHPLAAVQYIMYFRLLLWMTSCSQWSLWHKQRKEVVSSKVTYQGVARI